MSTAVVPELSHESQSPDFEAIFRLYSPMVYRTARAVTGNREDAEDIVQTIFLKLIRREYPPDLRKNPRAYLYRAAVNRSLDVIRARRRHALVHAVEDLEIPAAQTNEAHQRLHDVLAQLDSKAAEILILRYVHDYSDAEISNLLGKSRSAIAVRLFRLRARLKKLLREPLGEKP